jgi:hypothetical protein
MNTKSDEAFHAQRQKAYYENKYLTLQYSCSLLFSKMSLHRLSGEAANITRNNTTESTNYQRDCP